MQKRKGAGPRSTPFVYRFANGRPGRFRTTGLYRVKGSRKEMFFPAMPLPDRGKSRDNSKRYYKWLEMSSEEIGFFISLMPDYG
ncbi:MAG TPA: hypothetical protein VF903_10215 [Nitrospirota bacterium]